MKTLLPFVLLSLSTNLLPAQTKWELGLAGGISNYYGDLSPQNIVSTETKGTYGGFASFYIHPVAAFRINVMQSQISGKDANFPLVAEERKRGFDFRNSLTEVSFLLAWEPWAKKIWRQKKFSAAFSPYIVGGHGMVFHKPITNYHEDNQNFTDEFRRSIKSDKSIKQVSPSTMLYFGIGTKLFATRHLTFGFELTAKPVFSDYLDGVSRTGNMENKDWFFFGGLTASYLLHNKARDSDKDGVPDAKDKCPHDKGMKKYKGCPPPEKPKSPDTDGDGIPDTLDKCPTERGHVMRQGCPEPPRPPQPSTNGQ